MKKRFVCLLLTLVMVVSLIPAAAITASAAGLAISEAGIKVIKDYMGFKKDAYQVGTEYRIGYGTPSVKGATITEANADKYLREELANLDAVVNATISSDLVQKRHDALVWYSYVEGTAWTSSAAFVNAVNTGKTGSELADVMCSWDYDVAGYPNDSAAKGVLVRRMAMTNLYLYGTYKSASSGSLAYTVFDAGEGTIGGAQKMVQVFDCNQMNEINVADPTWGTSQFLGWYSGNALVTGVGSATSGKTLTAGWQIDGNKVAAHYSLPAYVIYQASGTPDNASAVVYNDPIALKKIDVVNRESTVSVVAEQIVGSDKWLELSTGGWVRLCTVGTVLPTIVPSVKVTITDDYVNIRKDPSVTAEKVGVAKRGETRVIVMTVAGDTWGYCSEGWLFLAYTNYNDKSSASSSASGKPLGAGEPAVITGAEKVNIRAKAGVQNNLVTQLADGTAITVYEETTVNGAAWGHIDQGWVSMGYVRKLSNNSSSSQSASMVAGSVVTVTGSGILNVRSGPGTEYSKIGTLNPGTNVTILQKQTVGGVSWALIAEGWINMNYVAPVNSSNGSTFGVGGTVVNCSSGVNVRSAAGTTNALVGVASVGSRVTVTEISEVSGHKWGHIDRGWVCMDYVQLDRDFPTQPEKKEDPSSESIVTSFVGYPAITYVDTPVRDSASADGKILMTLRYSTSINILDRVVVSGVTYGKVTVGSITGWVNLEEVTLQPVNAKVTAAKANAYELPNVRSKILAALVNDTYVTVGLSDGSGWEIADGTLWGLATVTTASGSAQAWIRMSDVTMFKDNTMPAGIVTTNGAGYLTGTLTSDTIVYENVNGNVSSNATSYVLANGHRVNVLARSYVFTTGETWAKVSIANTYGWINMADVQLDPVELNVTADLYGYLSVTDVGTMAYNSIITKGNKVTVIDRGIIEDANEVNHGTTDVGLIYIGDDMSNQFYVILDEGKLSYASAAPAVDPSNPSVLTSVVVTGKAPMGQVILEETDITSKVLMYFNYDSYVTVLNWKLVNGVTWGKVQVGNIIGWVPVDLLDFTGLKGTVTADDLYVYNKADKDSSVQIYHVKNNVVSVDPALYFDGSILWGKINISGNEGWIDLSTVLLNNIGATVTPELVIAKAKVNSVNASVSMADAPASSAIAEVKSLPKGTAVNLTDVEVAAGEAWWKVEMGSKYGWIAMDCISLQTTVARITEPNASVYDDLVTASMPGAKVLYTLYRDETVNVVNFKMQSGALYGEVDFGSTTGWIEIIDAYGNKVVSLTPGYTNNTPVNPVDPTNPTQPTTPATGDPIPAYIVCATTVNVRSGAGVQNALATTLKNGATVRIYEQTEVLGKKWAHIDEGWVCMDYVQLGTPATNPTTNPGTPSGTPSIMTSVPAGAIAVGYANQDVKIRTGSGLGYPEAGSVKKNNSVVIYEKVLDGGMSWGRTDNGWVCLSYLTITGIGAAGTGDGATIARCGFTANVRSSASYNGALMAKAMITSRVMVHEISGAWARTDLGWISTEYLVMDSAATPIPGIPDAAAPMAPTYTESDGSVG